MDTISDRDGDGAGRSSVVAGGRLRALSFTRHLAGAADGAAQREVFTSACAARGWNSGGAVRQFGGGHRAWAAAVRLVRRGGYDVVVVDALDRLAGTDAGVAAVLAMLRREGVRLLVARDGLDTGDAVGRGLVDSLLTGHAVPVAADGGSAR